MSKSERLAVLNEAQIHLAKDRLTERERREILNDLNAAKNFSRSTLRSEIAATIKLTQIKAAMPDKIAVTLWNPGAVSFVKKLYTILNSK
jgi:hypothetical protein